MGDLVTFAVFYRPSQRSGIDRTDTRRSSAVTSISPSPTSSKSLREVALGALPGIEAIAGHCGREDLVHALRQARARVERPETLLAVAGEFKKGKSSLVNGLLGEAVCPVDDDIATATTTLIQDGEQSVTSWSREGAELKANAATIADLPALVTEAGKLDRADSIAFVQVRHPNSFLGNGVAIIDTPGAGGLAPGYAEMTLAHLHAVDAVLFLSDASSPLTATEVDFLRSAVDVCDTVIVVLTKIDLYPHWREILEDDRRTLASAAVRADVVPVSSVIRDAAFQRRDRRLNDESGYPELLSVLETDVLDRTRERAAGRALDAARFAIAQLVAPLEAELSALRDPLHAESTLSQLQSGRERLERLRNASSRWQLLLGDRFGDVVSDVEHHFRQQMRELNRVADQMIEDSDPAETWDDITSLVRGRVADATLQLIRAMEAGADNVGREIVELLGDEVASLDQALGRARRSNTANLWTGRPPEMRPISESASTAWAGLRGAQGGIMVVGVLGGLAGMVLSTTMLVGIGAAFGGKQLFDERRRQVTQRRQRARAAIRQFLDDVQFESGKRIRDLSRELQRQLRDHFSERITANIRTCTATADALQRAIQEDQQSRERRIAGTAATLADLQAAQSALAGNAS